MRIVLDTNVLVSGLLHSQGNPGQAPELIQAVLTGMTPEELAAAVKERRQASLEPQDRIHRDGLEAG
jgi:predicted nucleic acid-binding protein